MASVTVITDSKTSLLEFSPGAVTSLVRTHDDVMNQYAQHVGRIDGAYQTRFWETWAGGGASVSEAEFPMATRMEENRLDPVVNTIQSALYPRAARSVVMPDYTGRGNAALMQASLNDWMMRENMQDMILLAILQTLIGGLTAFKVGYKPGTGRPMDRTEMVVCPYWEVMLDRQITCIGQERFYGHLVYKPRQAVEQEYGLKNLRGSRKIEPTPMLGGDSGKTRGAAGGTSSMDQSVALDEASAGSGRDEGDWVRVLEFYNLVDPLTSRRGRTYKGRMEVYVLGQDPKISSKPIVVEAMPFAKPDGTPLAPVVPLLFAHKPFHPFQPMSVLDPLMPQVRELNLWVTTLAQQARRSAQRKGWIKDGAFNGDAEQQLLNGADASFAHVTEGYTGDPKTAAGFYDPPRIDPLMMENIKRCDGAFVALLAQAPNYRGEVTEATKYETQAANRQTEIKLAKMATQLYNRLGQVCMLAGRSFIACMQDTSDSTGGWTDAQSSSTRSVADDVQLASAGAVRTDAVVDAAVEDAKSAEPRDALGSPAEAGVAATAESEIRGTASPTVPSVAATDTTDTAGQQTTVAVGGEPVHTNAEVAITERTYVVLVDGKLQEVHIPDLDASFEYTFVESTRSPLREEARKNAQLQLAEPMMKLWAIVEKGGADAVLAREQMVSFIESFELPQAWHPDNLAKAAERKRAEADKDKGTPDMATAGTGVVPKAQEAAPPPQDGRAMLQRAEASIANGDGKEGMQILLSMFKDDAEAMQMLDAAAKSPDPRAALLSIIRQLLAPQEQPPPPEATEPAVAEPPEEEA